MFKQKFLILEAEKVNQYTPLFTTYANRIKIKHMHKKQTHFCTFLFLGLKITKYYAAQITHVKTGENGKAQRQT